MDLQQQHNCAVQKMIQGLRPQSDPILDTAVYVNMFESIHKSVQGSITKSMTDLQQNMNSQLMSYVNTTNK